jgi:hypothetical protein
VAVDTFFYIGDRERNNVFTDHANGTVDEFQVYGTATADLIAKGGLTSDPNERLASPTQNFALSFAPVDSEARGEYLYVGSESTFRGLNVVLSTFGVGTGLDLQWQYWNGNAWQNLESGYGFTDQTANFTRNGTIYWTGDPANWTYYALNGQPGLFYVRASLAAGSYTTAPVESVIKTDILLFQYCGDVAALGQRFEFAPPVPTAVELQSFDAAGLDGAVELRWQTGSELRNLGFHLYRSASAGGPYERITSSMIPGLGSSPAGARYSYRDVGRVNGVPYFYELEDVEDAGKTKRHGPVSATPTPAHATGNDAADEPVAPPKPTSRISYGDPEAATLNVRPDGPRNVLLELATPGFFALPQPDGSVHLEVPGFETLAGAPAMPVRRTWVEALAGLGVRITSVQARDVVAFPLRPSSEAAEMIVARDGTVRAARRRLDAAFRSDRLSPESPARVVSAGFQGETKKALLELAPLRYDAASGRLLLARRLVVRLAFVGREPSERALGGVRGRRYLRRASHAVRNVHARLLVRGRGLYSVRYEDVWPASRSAVRATELRLSRQGEAVPYHLAPDAARFGPGSVLYFVSEGASLNPHGETAVYELERAAGVRMAVADAAPFGPATTSAFRDETWEKDRTYQAGLLEAPDLWLWDSLVKGAVKSYPFALSGLAAGAEPATLVVEMQGGSDFDADPDHHVRVSVNGTFVTESSWNGKLPHRLEARVPASALLSGDNRLDLESSGDTAAAQSLVFLNRFSLRHARVLAAEAGMIEVSFNSSGTASVSGLAPGSMVLETTSPLVSWRRGATVAAGGLLFRAEAGRRYLAVSPSAVLRPEVRLATAATLKSALNRAEYIVLGPLDLLPAAEPLLAKRRAQGLTARAVPVEQVYDEFGYGEDRPEALRDFLAYAYHNWQAPSPRYVLLLGDASYDFKDVLGTGAVNRVPPLMVRTSFLWTVSDPGYAAVNGEDGLPDVALGRLPAASLEEAERLVRKTLQWELAAARLAGRAVVVADNPDAAGNFEQDAADVASLLFAGREVERIDLSRLGTATRSSILDALDGGASFLSYLGHGGIAVWASENVLNNGDVQSLAPQSRQPLLFTMNCLNGYFHFPPMNSLAEELLKADERGVVAAFSPSGLSVNDAAHVFHKALLSEILSGRHRRLGDAVLAAQGVYAQSGAFPELLAIYQLLGDPALAIR